jgi:hypothetical protein
VKVIDISPQANEINTLLDLARQEDLLVRSADGREFMLVAVVEFDLEIVRTRQNQKLLAFLETRAKQTATISLDEVKHQLGL